ncbi:MAG: hydrogenobyrinic acid a,c-diamide synthase (glutamine-hydrolyzing) [Deltaproteobacteria bacterium]|nr:hydrogenobyrinic acid a,c-diamide synthase (glutamine-hydrolyzing) [Deltaproteobacteria bacterium]
MYPRIIIAALKGGSGKTILSLGLAAAWREKSLQVAPFKKGPDFIDAGWLSMAAEVPCYNLDPFLMNEEQIFNSFLNHSGQEGISLIEGNRGLYDGLDIDGCCSTAELGRLLNAPVLIVLDVTMTTRTMAALVRGCQVFDPELNIAGVILNRVAGPRQKNLITNAIWKYCGIPVVGSVPKLKENPFPERHMGLVPHQERDRARKAISWARKIVLDNLDLERIQKIAGTAPELDLISHPFEAKTVAKKMPFRPRIGFIRDQSLWFYYPENISELEKGGADLIKLDAISANALPDLDALYIGGGFPETQAQYLANNVPFRTALKEAIENGLPVYAECGGLIYLGEQIRLPGHHYPMVGALPLDFVFQKKPQGHGYTILETCGQNPYYPVGKILRGHEFHYSKAILTAPEERVRFAFKVQRGNGIDSGKDGICRKNVLGTYTHVHAAGEPDWVKGLMRAALNFKEKKGGKTPEKLKKNI